MSMIVGLMDREDIVIASDGCSGKPCSAHYVLKTAKINHDLCVGMTGDTVFMRRILPVLGLGIPDSVGDDDIFLHIEEKIGSQDIDFLSAWKVLNRKMGSLRRSLHESEDGVAVVLVGQHRDEMLHGQWDRDNTWWQEHWHSTRDLNSFSFMIGRPPATDAELRELWNRLDNIAGTSNAEERLITGVRYWAQCDRQQTVNRNVFYRRLSEGFKLRYDLDPDMSHSSEIQERLAVHHRFNVARGDWLAGKRCEDVRRVAFHVLCLTFAPCPE